MLKVVRVKINNRKQREAVLAPVIVGFSSGVYILQRSPLGATQTRRCCLDRQDLATEGRQFLKNSYPIHCKYNSLSRQHSDWPHSLLHQWNPLWWVPYDKSQRKTSI